MKFHHIIDGLESEDTRVQAREFQGPQSMIAIIKVALQQDRGVIYSLVKASSIGALTSKDKDDGLRLGKFTAPPVKTSVNNSAEHRNLMQ